MNTNPSAKRILCFGDSNTWGYIPASKHERYPSNVRWSGVLQNLLGLDSEIIEEGLNSRGIIKGDNRPGKEGRSAVEYIKPCLDTHDPLDFVIVMLGTNELKAEFNLTAEEISKNLMNLVTIVSTRSSQQENKFPRVVIIVPPIVNETTEYASKGEKYKGAYEKSKQLGKLYADIAKQTDSLLLNIQENLIVGEDGVHLTPQSHHLLANSIYSLLKD